MAKPGLTLSEQVLQARQHGGSGGRRGRQGGAAAGAGAEGLRPPGLPARGQGRRQVRLEGAVRNGVVPVEDNFLNCVLLWGKCHCLLCEEYFSECFA